MAQRVASTGTASNSKGAPTGKVAGSASGNSNQPRGHTPVRAHAGKASAPKVLPHNTKAPGMPGHGGSESHRTPPDPDLRSDTNTSPFSKFHGKSADAVHRAAKEDETPAGPQHPGYGT